MCKATLVSSYTVMEVLFTLPLTVIIMLTLPQYKSNHMLLTIQVLFEPVHLGSSYSSSLHTSGFDIECVCLDITDISDASVTLGVHALVSELVS